MRQPPKQQTIQISSYFSLCLFNHPCRDHAAWRATNQQGQTVRAGKLRLRQTARLKMSFFVRMRNARKREAFASRFHSAIAIGLIAMMRMAPAAMTTDIPAEMPAVIAMEAMSEAMSAMHEDELA
jgi:hypothetical protein